MSEAMAQYNHDVAAGVVLPARVHGLAAELRKVEELLFNACDEIPGGATPEDLATYIHEAIEEREEARKHLRDISEALSGGECPVENLAEQVGILGRRYAEQVDLCATMRKERDRLQAILDIETGRKCPEGWMRTGVGLARGEKEVYRYGSSGDWALWNRGSSTWLSLHPYLLEAIEAADV